MNGGLEGVWKEKNDDDGCKDGKGILAHHEKVSFSRAVKSTVTLDNGGKIIK